VKMCGFAAIKLGNENSSTKLERRVKSLSEYTCARPCLAAIWKHVVDLHTHSARFFNCASMENPFSAADTQQLGRMHVRPDTGIHSLEIILEK